MFKKFHHNTLKYATTGLFEAFSRSAARQIFAEEHSTVDLTGKTSLPPEWVGKAPPGTKKELENIFLDIMKKVKRETPDLIPTIDGVPVSIEELESEYVNNIKKDIIKAHGRILFVEVGSDTANNERLKGAKSYRWSTISNLHGKLSGKPSEITKFLKSASEKKAILNPAWNVPVPLSLSDQGILHEWFKNVMTNYVFKNGIQLSLGAGETKFGVLLSTTNIDNKPVRYYIRSKIRANIGNKIGETLPSHIQKTMKPGGSDEFDRAERGEIKHPYQDKFIYTDSESIPYQVELWEDDGSEGSVTAEHILPTDIEHIVPQVGSELYGLILALEATIDGPLKLAKENSNKMSPEDNKITKIVEQNINKALTEAKQALALIKVFGRGFAGSQKISQDAESFVRDELIPNLDSYNKKLGLFLSIQQNDVVKLEEMSITSNWIIESGDFGSVFGVGTRENNRGFQGGVEKFLKGLMAKWAITQSSPAPVTVVMFAALANIFQDESFLSQIKSYKGKNKKYKVFIPVSKTKSVRKPRSLSLSKVNINKPNSRGSKKHTNTGGPGGSQSNNNFNSYAGSALILDAINIQLRQAVIQQMRGGVTLNNVSGRFAESVKATEVIKSRSAYAIRYKYMKRPYNVFSASVGVGKDPWNRFKARDPTFIIDRAIRSITKDKFLEAVDIVTGPDRGQAL